MKYKTCVSITEKTPKKLEQTLKKALKESEYVELRLDFLRPINIPDALDLVRRDLKRCVCTLRPKFEGGVFEGSEKERISILKLIAQYNPYLIDIEYATLVKNKNLFKYIKSSRTKLLVSWHDFHKTPKNATLNAKLKQMKKYSNNIKIVTSAKTIHDVSQVLGLYEKSSRTNLIAFCMGDVGRISRILCLYMGSPYTYASLGKAIAPGQFNVREIKKIAGLKSRRC